MLRRFVLTLVLPGIILLGFGLQRLVITGRCLSWRVGSAIRIDSPHA